jgi:hypothetical protein
MSRKVKGSLFVDYVRMIRATKHVDWSARLPAGDLALLRERILPDAWYPMETFERIGNAIFAEIAGGDLSLVSLWGRLSVDELAALYDGLLVEDNPRESLMRFNVLRGSFFDFPAVTISMLIDHKAHVVIDYQMGEVAEEAASHQTLGFFERLLEASGAREVHAAFLSRRWIGEPRTVLQLTWSTA